MTIVKNKSLEDHIAFWHQLPGVKNSLIHEFPTLPASERLHYEPLSYHNYQEVLTAFANDEDPFLEKMYFDEQQMMKYASCALERLNFTGKYGCKDWLVRNETGDCVGMIHLFDISRETINDRHLRCSIGFAITKANRRKGYGAEAINWLIQYAFDKKGKEKILAYCRKDNVAAHSLLEKLNFKRNDAQYYYRNKYAFFERYKE